MDPSEHVLDVATVTRLRALAESVARPGEHLIARLVEIFTTDSRTRLVDCRAAWHADDHIVAGRAAHTIKGSAGNLGAHRVVEAARVIEEACKAGAPVNDDMLATLDSALVEAHDALRAL